MKDYNDLTARLRSAAVEEGMERRQLLLSAAGAIDEMQKELTPYKEAQADNRLVVLPCKEGTQVYKISHRLNGKHEIMETWFNLTYLRPADFGKTIFLTREAAEAALQNMEGSA